MPYLRDDKIFNELPKEFKDVARATEEDCELGMFERNRIRELHRMNKRGKYENKNRFRK